MTILRAMPLEYQQQRGKDARRAILDAVEAMEDAGERPTTRSIARAVGLSKSTVAYHITELVKSGWLVTRFGRNGGTFLSDAGREARKD